MQAPSVTMTTLGPSRVQLSLCDREKTENSEAIVEMTLKLPPPPPLSSPLGLAQGSDATGCCVPSTYHVPYAILTPSHALTHLLFQRAREGAIQSNSMLR